MHIRTHTHTHLHVRADTSAQQLWETIYETNKYMIKSVTPPSVETQSSNSSTSRPSAWHRCPRPSSTKIEGRVGGRGAGAHIADAVHGLEEASGRLAVRQQDSMRAVASQLRLDIVDTEGLAPRLTTRLAVHFREG